MRALATPCPDAYIDGALERSGFVASFSSRELSGMPCARHEARHTSTFVPAHSRQRGSGGFHSSAARSASRRQNLTQGPSRGDARDKPLSGAIATPGARTDTQRHSHLGNGDARGATGRPRRRPGRCTQRRGQQGRNAAHDESPADATRVREPCGPACRGTFCRSACRGRTTAGHALGARGERLRRIGCHSNEPASRKHAAAAATAATRCKPTGGQRRGSRPGQSPGRWSCRARQTRAGRRRPRASGPD
jgi:hypothetical protein